MDSVDAGTVGHVFIDALRERVRLLENHTDALSKLDRIHILIDICSIQGDLAFDPHALKNVDLPQPDGPMSAVISCSGISRVMFFSA